ncbi:ribosomal protein S18-alanine N-acetyltransferase [Candidatus Chlorohelix sp.]|uniref:ribosomal protein S18-alanine N-acetyltransferase n=1 Tax=Candidatus Chlorohelix sp. TaxID=3139201 RepID=UPI003054ABB3
MPFLIESMRVEDIPEVVEIERICFATPWPASAYRRELQNTSSTRYVVVRQLQNESEAPANTEPPFLDRLMSPLDNTRPDKPPAPTPNSVIGYAGLWMMMDEAHITTIGVHPLYRGNRLGELMLVGLIDIAMQLGSSWLTLEVRVSNNVAQNLYRKYYFDVKGMRRKYYTDNDEDAYVMWTDNITTPEYRQRYFQLKRELLDSLANQGEVMPIPDVFAPLVDSPSPAS